MPEPFVEDVLYPAPPATVTDMEPYDFVNPPPRVPGNAGISIPVTELLQLIGTGLLDDWVQQQYTSALETLLREIAIKLPAPGLGYLVRVNRWDLFGVPHVPGGVLLTPIGVGTEPIDALATSMWHGILEPIPQAGAVDKSTYLWFERNQSGEISLYREIAGNADGFSSLAYKEHIRRKLQGFDRKDLAQRLRSISQTKAWVEQCEALSNSVADATARERLTILANEMRVSQARFDQAYESYRTAELAARSSSSFLRVLQAAAAVANLISAVGAVKPAGANIGGQSAEARRIDELAVLNRNQMELISAEYEQVKQTVDGIIRIQTRAIQVFRELGQNNHPPMQQPLPVERERLP